MPRPPDSGQLDLADVFSRLQHKLLADLAISGVFEHPSANGMSTERLWIDIFTQYLPRRYRVAPAFIINSSGRRSRQIDIAIFDNHQSTPLFPHSSGDHVPIESVYAIFEVKPSVSKQWLRDAGEKAASVRELSSSNRKILAGLLGTTSVWQAETFPTNLRRALKSLPPSHRIDFGCALEHRAFEHNRSVKVSDPGQTLIFFLLRFVTGLNALGPAPEVDLLDYLKRARPKQS